MKEFVTLTLREQQWTFRALDLDQIERLEPQFIAVGALSTAPGTLPKEGLAAVAEIACESLRYKHPEITVAVCRGLLTLGTLQTVIEAVRGVSALEPVGEGEAPARVV